MPVYEYQCSVCGKVEEAIQKFSDKPLTKCRVCSGKLHKLISQSAFHLKGTGWYVTDYAGKKSRDTKTNNKEPAAVKETKSTDAKPAEKSVQTSAD